jgi:zinc transport system permease protein
MAISVSKGVNIDLNSYLFGSILAVSWTDVILSGFLALIVVALYLFAYHRIFAITFDEEFAKSVGVKTGLYDAIFAAICSVVIVLGMRLLGSLLISSLIIFPTLSAMRLCSSFKKIIMASVIISILAFVAGLMMSYSLATPTGATVVIMNLVAFIICYLLGKIQKS